VHLIAKEDQVWFNQVMPQRMILITQNEIDMNGAEKIGLFAVCLSGSKKSITYMRNWLYWNSYIRDIVYVVTNGSEKVMMSIQKAIKKQSILWSPSMDLTAYVEHGGTQQTFLSTIKDIAWENPE
jgi:hypothetical protein